MADSKHIVVPPRTQDPIELDRFHRQFCKEFNDLVDSHDHTSSEGGGDYAWADIVAADVTYLQALLADITQTNLVDKSAAETVTGTWTFSGGSIGNTTRVTTTYTVLATDEVIFCDTDDAAFTVTLPAGVEGTHYKIINCGSNTLTVDPNGTEELYGEGAGVAITLVAEEVIDIHFNTTEGWF